MVECVLVRSWRWQADSCDRGMEAPDVAVRRQRAAERARWAYVVLPLLCTMLGGDVVNNSALVTARGMSTMFTGMGSAEMAVEHLRAAAVDVGLPMQVSPTFALDINPLTRSFMAARYGVEHPVFADIMNLFMIPFWNDDWPWQHKFKMLLFHCPIRDTWFDEDTRQYVPIPHSDVDTSGSPCVDYSTANSHTRDGRNGKYNQLFLAWASWHIRKETRVLFHENVANFDIEFALLVLGGFYICYVLYVEPAHAGFGHVARSRSIIVAFHRKRCKVVANVHDVYKAVSTMLQASEATVEDLFLAQSDEIVNEEVEQCIYRERVPLQSSNLTYTLHTTLQKYVRVFDFYFWSQHGTLPSLVPWLLYHLQDNPHNHLTWSANSRKMPALRRDSRFVWSPFLKRWVTFNERLAGMGWPVYMEQATSANVAQWIPPSRCVEVQHALGDSIHIANLGVVIAVGLSCVHFL